MLTVKMKEFVVLGVLASRGLQYGMKAHMRPRARGHRGGVLRGHQSRGRPGGRGAYRVGVRALHALEQAGVFAPPTPPPAVRGRRGTATSQTSPPPPTTRRRKTGTTR